MPRSLINSGSICMGVLLTIYALVSTLFLSQERVSAALGSGIPVRMDTIGNPLIEPVDIEWPEPGSTISHSSDTSPQENSQANRDLNLHLALPQGKISQPDSTPSLPGSPAALEPEIPVRIVIPAIDLDAPVQPVSPIVGKLTSQEQQEPQNEQVYRQWPVPDLFAAGWHADSARLGEIGNTVLNGHHNISGKVFGRLIDLEPGDVIQVYSKESLFIYLITNKMIFPERYQDIDARMTNAQWILPSQDERLTLITCWPELNNTHRLIIVARPIGRQNLNSPEKPISAYK